MSEIKNRMPRTRRRSYYIPLGCVIPFFIFIAILAVWITIPLLAARTYGPSSESLSWGQRFQYAAMLLWYNGQATRPVDSAAGEQKFSVATGESVADVAVRLEQAGLVRSAGAFRAYLIYRGMDTTLQAGEYTLSAALSPLQIAERLQDATPAQVKFVILPGWRVEEIAQAFDTAGLQITPDDFLAAAHSTRPAFDSVPAGATVEGFLFPDEYILPRTMRAQQVIDLLMSRFDMMLTPEMRENFSRRNLSTYQAVTLASILQREAVQSDEQPLIASVLLNRLEAGMNLQTDPTIQYALGFDAASNSWWKSPLSLADLTVDSAYNTYIHLGLPPGPIANPSLTALQAVAFPADTPYLFFRARCDGSGRHNFAETFEEHLENGC
jgi:UPF0755 protein